MNPFKNKSKTHKIKFLNSRKLLQYCISVTLLHCLTGCMGVYEGGFECPPEKGVGCKSISEVNQMINQCPVTTSIECSECKIPGLKITRDPEDTSQAESPPLSSEIWYAPWAVSTVQYSNESLASPLDLFEDKGYGSISGQIKRISPLDAQGSI